MSEGMSGSEELLQRINELLDVLNMLSRDLAEISKALRAVSVPTTVTSPVMGKVQAIEDVRMLFPKDLEAMLEFEETEEHVLIRPRGYLGSENFAKIASIIRDAGGEYISAGRDSHFRVFKEVT